MGFLRLLFVPEAVCMLKLNSNHFWHASSAHIISVAGCVFLTVNRSLIYICIHLFLTRNITCVCAVLGGNPGHVQPSKDPARHGGVWSCCLPCFCPILAVAAVAWGISGGLLTYLWVLWPILGVIQSHEKSWWDITFSWCAAPEELICTTQAAGLGHAPPLFPTRPP